MKIQADLSEVVGDVEPGTYKVRVMKGEPGEWSTGTKYVNWQLEIFDDEKFNGRSIWHRTPITGKGAFRTVELFAAATGEKLSKDSPEFDTEQVQGREIQVQLQAGYRDGKPTGYNEVSKVVPLS